MRWGQWRRIKMIIMMMFTTTRCPLITMWRQTVGSCFPTFNHYKMAFCADTKVQSVPTCFCVLAFLSLSFLRHWGWWMLVPRISKCSIEWQFFIFFPKQITKQQLKNSLLFFSSVLCVFQLQSGQENNFIRKTDIDEFVVWRRDNVGGPRLNIEWVLFLFQY